MYNNIWWAWNWPIKVSSHVEVRCQSIKDLTGICEVCFEGVDVDRRVRKWDEVEVEDFVALREQVRNDMSTCFSTSTCKDLFDVNNC
jgi:hypothetical protein